jgi:2'-5' RNA ligase
VLPLSPLREGDTFAVSEWPLHITVLPPFLTDATGSEVGTAIRSVASAHPAFTAVASQDELFGRRHDIPVTLVAENKRLTALHRELREALLPFAATPEEPAFTGAGIRPHVTVKTHGRVHAGDELALTQLAVVDMAPRTSPGRTVLATIDLARADELPSSVG